MTAFDPEFESLPATLPIFPLTGVLMLPRGRLPLNIFEPRYLNMVTDAMGGNRMFGMVQPFAAQAEDAGGEPTVYPTGCAGRITHFEETEDGRFILSLRGVCRFCIVEEVPTIRGYRRCAVDWEPFARDLTKPEDFTIDRERLVMAVRAYFSAKGLEANWEAIEKAKDEHLVTSIAMLCPFDPSEKQALLEATDLITRAALLTTIVEMAALDNSDGVRQ
jgi:Lon protease-like protein